VELLEAATPPRHNVINPQVRFHLTNPIELFEVKTNSLIESLDQIRKIELHRFVT